MAAEEADSAPADRDPPHPLPLDRLFAKTPKQMRRRNPAPRRSHHPIAFALNMLLFVGVLAMVAVINRWQAPNFVSTRTETAIEAALPGIDAELGEALLGLEEGRPVLALRDAVLRDADGGDALRLANLELVLNRKAALSRQLRPETLTISEMELALSRDREGRFNLAFGNDGAAVQAASLAGLVRAADDFLARPSTEALRTASIDQLHVTYSDERTGQSWRAEGSARLTREDDDLRLSTVLDLPDQGEEAELELGWDSSLGDAAALLSLRMRAMPAADLAGQFPALAWLAALDAPISGALRAEARSDDSIGPLSATLSIGQGALRPTEASRPVPFDSASVYLTYEPTTRALTFDQIAVTSAWGEARAHGQAFLEGASRPDAIAAQITVDDPVLDLPGTFAAPVTLDQIGLEFRTRFQPFTVEIADAHTLVNDQLVRLTGTIGAGDQGWSAALDAQAGEVSVDELLALWPLPVAPGSRRWVEGRVKSATIRDLIGAFRLTPGAPPERYASFRYEDARLAPLDGFPEIEQIAGNATLIGDRFAFLAQSGQLSAPDADAAQLGGTQVEISGIGTKPAHAHLDLALNGPIPAVMRLLDEPPFSLLTSRGISPDLASGEARGQVQASWDLQPGNRLEDIDWQAEVSLGNVQSNRVVEGRRLEADRLTVTAAPDRLAIGGAGQLDELAFDATWQRALGPNAAGQAAQVAGRAWLDAAAAEAFDIGLPDGTLGAGRAPADFTLTLPAGRAPRLALQSSLEGLALAFPALGISKSRNARGELSVDAVLGPTPRLDRLSLSAGGLQLDGTLSTDADGLQAAHFPDLRVGDWLRGDVRLAGRGPGLPPAISLQNARVDWRRFPRSQSRSGGQAGAVPLRVSRSEFILTDRIQLAGLEAELSLGRAIEGRFSGQFGRAALQGEAQNQGGETRWRIVTDDAGAALSALGLLDRATGGQAQLDLQPISATMHQGEVRLRNLRVQQWPLLGGALNTLSLVGIVDQLSGNGLTFAEGEARFRLTQGGVWLDSLALVGPAVGVSAEGAVNFTNNRLRFEGVLSPAYVLNSLGRAISPRDGEGAFGFQFDVFGTTQSPQLQVNPASILLPGGLRELLR